MNQPMSKLYTSALALALVASSATAQNGNDAARPNERKIRSFPVRTEAQPIVQAADRAVIWSDDFSDPSTWIPSAIAGFDQDNWVIGTDGPAGGFAIADIASTTAANGFALFDSDLYCGLNQQSVLQMATPVDLTDEPGVVLEFEQFFRRFRGDCFVDVSINGTDWFEFEVNADVAVNDDTGNPNLAQVNITSVAGGQGTVWIRFRYYSTPDVHGPDAGCDYAWMVDDVAFVTLPDFEISMEYGYTSTTGTGEEFGRIPSAQLPSSMNVGAGIFNFGGQEQTNVVVSMEVLDAASNPVPGFTATTTIATIPSQTEVVTDEDVTLPTLANGVYTANFTMTSDQIGDDEDPSDNSQVRNFEVTTDIYSLDAIGNHPEGTEELFQIGSGSFDSNEEGLKIMTMYFVNTPMTVTGFEIALGPASGVGGSVIISILDTADVLATPSQVGNPINGIESNPYVLTAADITAGTISVPFPSPITLQPNAYYATATVSGNGSTAANDPDFFILDDATVPQPGLASAIYLPFDFDDDGNEGPHLYTNGTASAVRMTTNPTISVGETEELSGVTMYPNPTNGVLRINSDASEKYFVEVINVLGEVVMTNTFAGNTVLDLAAFADGVYSVRVSNGTKATVQRITLN